MSSEAIAIIAAASSVGFFVSALANGCILRASIILFNVMAGGAKSSEAVPVPRFVNAVGISLIIGIAYGLLITGIALYFGLIAAPGAKVEIEINDRLKFALLWCSVLISLLVSSAGMAMLLPTTVQKAMVLNGIQLLLLLGVAAALWLIYLPLAAYIAN